MHAVFDFLLKYGYWVLFLNVMAEQLAIPVPATPVLLAMGALVGLQHFSFLGALLTASTACLICDQIWYQLGKTRGQSILRLVCKMSLEPDSCVSNTKTTFARWGAWSLLFAKFVPGLSAVAAPMAGLTRMRLLKFTSADFAGAVAWTGSMLTLGYAFRTELEHIAEWLRRLGGWMVVIAAVAVAGYIAAKYWQRRRFIHGLRVDRIQPHDLHALMLSRENPLVVDLRHPLELQSNGVKLPGAMLIAPDAIESGAANLMQGREVILYCS